MADGPGAHVVVRGTLVTLEHVTTGATRPVVPPPGPRQPAPHWTLDTAQLMLLLATAHTMDQYQFQW